MNAKSILYFLVLFCIIPIFAFAFKLPDTGQTKCYNNSGAEIACSGTGQDGDHIINAFSYTDNGNGTITDNNTGLMWQQRDTNNSYNWYMASGTYHSNLNPSSFNYCGSLTLGGHSDWRLPTRVELMSLVDYGIGYPGPALDPIFHATPPYPGDWTSVTSASQPDEAWGVSFTCGGVGLGGKDDSHSTRVRCVRGERIILGSFTDNHDGTVTDNQTGLIWQQGEPGNMNWQAALNYCENLVLGNRSDWRLPNFKELETILDDTRFNPAINTVYFPNVQYSESFGFYWTSTTYCPYRDGAWSVKFYDGSVVGMGKIGNPFVRCVSGGQSAVFLPAWIVGTANYFTSLQDAHDSASNGNIIKSRAVEFTEHLDVTKILSIIGGFDSGYNSNNGFSNLQGLTIKDGSLTVERLVIGN